MPMPSNDVRGAVTKWVVSVMEIPAVRYSFMVVMALDVLYFYFVMDALTHPLYDLGLLTPIDQAPSCEARVALFRNERNAYITGFSLFMFLVLRRLVDIQQKLHVARGEAKSGGAAPMGVPMGQPVAYDGKKRD